MVSGTRIRTEISHKTFFLLKVASPYKHSQYKVVMLLGQWSNKLADNVTIAVETDAALSLRARERMWKWQFISLAT